jgi:lipoprotein-anchoring transpeptidase ErfK/SrfK
MGSVRSLKEVDAARSRALTALPASLIVPEAESRLRMAMVDRREVGFEAMKLALAPAGAGEVPVRQALSLVAAPAVALARSPAVVALSPASQSLEEGHFVFNSAAVPASVVAPLVFDKMALKPAPAPKLVPAVKRLLLVRVRESGTTDANADSEASDPLLASDAAGGHPMTLVVSLKHQRLDVYRGADLIESSKVSSGMRGHETMTGVFGILEKRRYHHSNIYSGAPMPWMQRLTRSGTALHGGVVPGYPASHGCIRLPFAFAPRLFKATELGMNVVIAGDDVVPVPIDHPVLPQPLDPGAAAAGSGPEVVTTAGAERARVPDGLRILITRRTDRDRLIGLQTLLASMGYLKPQQFTGRVGRDTIAAIRNFQADMGMHKTGEIGDELISAVYRTAGRDESPAAHMFVRRGFFRIFDVPVRLKDPDLPLGTHLLVGMKAEQEAGGISWLALTLEGDGAASALDRFVIPDQARLKLAALVASGSSFIIGEKSVDTAILPEGDDFMVRAKEVPVEAETAKVSKPAKKVAKQARGKTKQASRATTRKSVRRYYYYYPPQVYVRRGLFMRR